jgi:hypothetical protein
MSSKRISAIGDAAIAVETGVKHETGSRNRVDSQSSQRSYGAAEHGRNCYSATTTAGGDAPDHLKGAGDTANGFFPLRKRRGGADEYEGRGRHDRRLRVLGHELCAIQAFLSLPGTDGEREYDQQEWWSGSHNHE